MGSVPEEADSTSGEGKDTKNEDVDGNSGETDPTLGDQRGMAIVSSLGVVIP